jgi:hypothetical protein
MTTLWMPTPLTRLTAICLFVFFSEKKEVEAQQ